MTSPEQRYCPICQTHTECWKDQRETYGCCPGHPPGLEAREAFISWWLADLADRHPGRRFRLVEQ